jgi:hypothetical protein
MARNHKNSFEPDNHALRPRKFLVSMSTLNGGCIALIAYLSFLLYSDMVVGLVIVVIRLASVD